MKKIYLIVREVDTGDEIIPETILAFEDKKEAKAYAKECKKFNDIAAKNNDLLHKTLSEKYKLEETMKLLRNIDNNLAEWRETYSKFHDEYQKGKEYNSLDKNIEPDDLTQYIVLEVELR